METADLNGLSLAELKSELATLASHLYAGTCRWLELVADLDRRGGWAEAGIRSCAEWLAWRCALTPRAAREHVRVARLLPELPLIHAAFAGGELSYAKVRALTRVATAESEQELLYLARVMTAAQLERTMRGYRRVTTEEARERQEDAQLSVFWNEDGSLELHGRLAPEEGALLLRALEAMRDSRWRKECGSAEPRPVRQASNAEALVAVAEAALAKPDANRPAGERYQVVVHADEAALAEDDGEGGCELEDGSALAAETARRLSCDASLVRNGRKTRAISPALRRALRRRDRGCRFPGCENRRFLDAHHVHHWARGGPDDARQPGAALPPPPPSRARGRLLHHERGRFYHPWGEPFPTVPALPRGQPDELLERHRHLGIDADTCESGIGERLDLTYAVDAVLAAVAATTLRTRPDVPI
jgi:hypothetical protein